MDCLPIRTAPQFATRALHAGYRPGIDGDGVHPPLDLSAAFAFPSAESGGARFAGEETGPIYGRLGTPLGSVLEARMAALEGTEAALATGSGMGAISATLWTLLNPGDVLVADATLYGCTYALFEGGLARFGIKIEYRDFSDAAAIARPFPDNTRIVYVETPANPSLKLVDIAAVARAAHKAGALLMVDNTFASPALQRPASLGADLVVHSASKYLSGHGDVIAGILCGPAEILGRIRLDGIKNMTGAALSPLSAHLVLRGIATLDVRMDRQGETALKVARLLEKHPAVAAVHYPGLASHPQAALARKQMKNGGAMVALELKGGRAAGIAFMNRLNLFVRAVSLGDCISLAQHPASMTHSTYTKEALEAHGIAEGLVRLSIGLEAAGDLIADLEQALMAS